MDLADEDPELGILSSLDHVNGSHKAVSSSPSYFSYTNDYRNDSYHDHVPDHDIDGFPTGLRTPSLLSSPSLASSLGFSTGRMSPLRQELSRPPSRYHDDELDASPTARRSTGRLPPERSRDVLARRLSHLAEQLSTSHDDLEDDGVDALTTQLDQLERAMTQRRSPYPNTPLHRKSNSYAQSSPLLRKSHSRSRASMSHVTPQRPQSVDFRSRTDTPGGGSLFTSPASSVFRTRFSDLSASIFRDPEPEPEPDPPPKRGMTVQQANKVVAEAMKLNDELTTIVTNLKARQEESDHIHELLVERAERAAQRIIFLQNRIAHLEDELQENDDELQHLRICLKAVEIQMPPHPDRELQRCIATFKQDYQALKRKRANRSSMASIASNSTLDSPSSTR